MIQEFKPLVMPLHGINLIEASAGTGKTFNVAALFARLVLLEQMAVEHILVVTFTKAATAELKTRLRARLNDALTVLQNGTDAHHPPDEVLASLLHAARQQESDAQLILRLQAAINQFDGAAIYTIHGFCQRVLSDYAFLCQCPFDTETAEADPKLLRTFAEDYWRRHISHNAELAPLVAASGLTPQQWVHNLGVLVNRADLHIRRPAATMADDRRALQHAWARLVTAFDDMRTAFWRLHPHLNGNSYRKATFDAVFTELAEAVHTGQPRYAFSKSDKLAWFDADVLHSKAKKGQQLNAQDVALLAPLAAFGSAYLALAAAEKAALLQVQLDCLTEVRAAMSAHKRNSHQRSFDDLLADVATALSAHNPQASQLAAALARNWHIALIDECQDTDPLQYHIFKTAFADQGRPLLMVGDPKQAIYSFRGADIHAYLQAAADTAPERRYTLTTNYRSHQKLVQSIGHLFAGKSRPFVLDGIDYTPVQAHREHSCLSPTPPALSIRWLHENTDTDDGGTAQRPNKEVLRQRAANWCADEVAATINRGCSGMLKLAGQPLQAGHIAILVRTHNEGKMVADALRTRGVSSVSLGNQSVYTSVEADALCALLRFWLHPQQTEVLRYVLGSVLYAWTAAQLTVLNADEAALNRWLTRAEQARHLWQQHGVYAALQWFAGATGLESGLLCRRAERSLTNFWQLAELLADAATELPTQTALVQWLAAQIRPEQRHGDEALLRLESDEALVKIVTMHAAKGLEYPIVYCPFVWDGKDATRTIWHIIHHDGKAELVHQDMLGTDDEAALMADHMGEMLRLYYVAFTRACEQLVLYAAAGNSLRDNPFAYLLDGQRDGNLIQSRHFWDSCKNQWVPTLQSAWHRLIDAAPKNTDMVWCHGAPPVAQVAAQAAPAMPYQARVLPPRLFDSIYHTSFTALSRHAAPAAADDEDLRPIIDAAEVRTAPLLATANTDTGPETPLLAFARGMNAGLCLHALLEATDFSHPAAAQATVYPPLLTRFGFDATLAESLHDMIDAVRQVPLFADSTLADIPADRRVAEMEFMLHMRDFTLPALQSWLAQAHLRLPANCVQAAKSLDFATVNGFLNGAIDLVCEDTAGRVCVIDYKSNHLGNCLDDYHQANMDAAMAEHHYTLQALIYSIAVARFLAMQNRLPASIAVRYLFVRGLNSHNDNGVWRWDIATADLQAWLPTHDKD